MSQSTTLFARAAELARLNAFLERSLAGEGQVCLLSGRAGTGKTFLLGEFVRHAQEQYPDVIVSVGNCDAQSGMANPYLPFREALNLLIGAVDERSSQNLVTNETRRRISKVTLKVAEILVAAGPDLIGLLVPGGDLMSKVATQAVKLGKTSVEKTNAFKAWENRLQPAPGIETMHKSALDQNQIYEQCSNVLCQLADHQPLILILDDLHWADAASIGLLFRLGRRLASRPLLIVGAYRPDEVASGSTDERHPLTKVLTEFKRYLGDIWIDLDQATAQQGEAFVDAFLASLPNRLDSTFRRQLYHHTQGHPLFTIELFRQLQQLGGVVQSEDGVWTAGNALRWDTLPKRVEGVVEERCARLSTDLRDHLTVGSVEGEYFTAEVVAQVRATDVRSLVGQLSNIAQDEQHLIAVQGVQRVGGRRVSTYEFTSSVIQTFLYQSLDAVERSYMHEDVGNALEALYQEQASIVAVQLARHFDLADLPDKALPYLRLAGDQAAAGYAHTEAVHHYSRALELMGNADADARYELLLAREKSYSILGNRAAQTRDLDELMTLAEQSGDPQRRAEATLRRAALGVLIGNFEEALADGTAAINLAQQANSPLLEAWARYRCGSACWQLGHYTEARQHLAQALAITAEQPRPDIEANVYYELGVVAYYENNYVDAIASLQAAETRFVALADRQGEARCLSLAGVILDITGDHGPAMSKFATALELARQVGWRYAEARFLNQSGENLIQLGDYDHALEQLGQAVAISRELEDHDAVAKSLDMCGMAALFQKQFGTARIYFDEALALHRRSGSKRGQGFVLTHMGALLTATDEWEAAIDTLNQALDIRLASDAQPLVVDTLATLAQLAMGLGDPASAGGYVDEIVAWIQAHDVDGIEYPIQVYLTCCEVLTALGPDDPAKAELARTLLSEGHDQMMARANRLADDMRADFLHNVPFNRAFHELWVAGAAAVSDTLL